MDYYDRDGMPITMEQWMVLYEDITYQRVARWEGEGGIEVITSWLGMDHGHGRTESPILFETMIFGGPEHLDQECTRYSTFGDAQEGHLRTVSDIIEGRPVWFTVDEVFL